MSRVIVITSGKGGVGKTTSCANIGAALAMQNYKVVLIDTDIGLRNLDVVIGLENRIVFDLVDIVEEKCKLRQALIRDKRNENLFLIPAAQSRDKNAVTPEQMRNIVKQLSEEFDFILIDCPAGIEQGFKNAIAAAQEAYVVAVPEISSVRDADRIIGLLEANEINNIKLIINRIKMNMVNDGNMLSIDDIVDILGVKPIGIVPDDESVIISSNRGEPLVYKGDSLGAKAYMNIAKRILNIDVDFLDLEARNGIVGKFKKLFSRK